MTRYLSADDVVQINLDHIGAGLRGAEGYAGVAGAVGRISQTWNDVDFYPTVWDKAGALLHGLASTQYFIDGNKRTAILVSELFLALNGYSLNDGVPVIAKEAFVMAVSKNLLGVSKAAEWFEANRLGAATRRRSAFLAQSADWTGGEQEGSTVDAWGAMPGHVYLDAMPQLLEMSLVAQIGWQSSDAFEERNYRIYVEGEGAVLQEPNAETAAKLKAGEDVVATAENSVDEVRGMFTPLPEIGLAHQPSAVHPTLMIRDLYVRVESEGLAWVVMEIEGDVFCRLALEFHGGISPAMH